MIKCIVGKMGSGKTKQLVYLVNHAADNESGSVLCIEKGPKLMIDISHAVRLVDIDNYQISGYDQLFSFICGLYAANFDTSYIFIDSLYKVAGGSDPAQIDRFIKRLEDFAAQNSVRFAITISDDIENCPASVKKHL